MGDVCFWSVGDGEYALMAQALVNSFRAVGMKEDFHVFSDRKIDKAITHIVGQFDKRGYYFKLFLLQQQVQHLGYSHYVYIDADSLFIRRPERLLDVLEEAPLHFFFECDCTQPGSFRKDWWGCPLEKYVQMMRDCGVTSDKVYNVNSGLFVMKREAVDTACGLALDFAKYAAQQGFPFPDEPGWAYAMHMLCNEPEKHLLSTRWDLWCSDWEGVFAKQLPNGQPWIFKEYMSFRPHTVNPAIVHAIKSKDLLIALGNEQSND